MALLAGAIIGWDRQTSHKPAGLRTHMLVSLGAALFTMVPIELVHAQPDPAALSRIVQGVATGVGFLGAGEIIHRSSSDSNKPKVRGLTSAAAIWVSAGLGVVIGSGLLLVGLVGSLLTLFTLTGVKQLERYQRHKSEDDE